MIISDVKIQGFRSIKDCSIKFHPFQVLLGPNSAGKSNLLFALEFFFETKGKLDIQEFYQTPEKIHVGELCVTITFSNLTEEEKRLFSKYVLVDDTIKVMKICKIEEGIVSQPEYHGIRLIPKDKEYRCGSYDGTPTECFVALQEKFGDVSEHIPEGRKSLPLFEQTLENLVERDRGGLEFEEVIEGTNFMGWKNVASGMIGKFLILPAIADPGVEASVKSGSYIQKMMNTIYTEIAETSEEYSNAIEQLEEVVSKFNRLLSDGGPNKDRPEQLSKLEESIKNELSEWDVDVEFVAHPPDVRSFLISPEVFVDDGYRSCLSLKGEGLQRSFIFALLNIWKEALLRHDTESEDKIQRPVIIAIEEPELYLHPQQQRVLYETLLGLSLIENHQVVVTSHSPIFINMDNPLSIIRVQKSEDVGTQVLQLEKDPFEGNTNIERKNKFKLTQWINPARGELFFASKCILVEGATESAAIPFGAKKLDIFRHDVTLVTCGGKHAIPLYQDLLTAFGIPHLVVYDEDPISAKPGDEKYTNQKRLFDLNGEIASKGQKDSVRMASPDVEGVIGSPKNQKDKKGAPLAAVDYIEGNGVSKEFENLIRWIYQ